MTNMEYIKTRLSVPELLTGLAEESAELSQAALKHRRALDGTNPTPRKACETILELLGEVADVVNYLDALGLADPAMLALIQTAAREKRERWAERLAEKEAVEHG